MADIPAHAEQPHEDKKPSEQGYDFSQQIGYLLRRAYQRHTAIFQKLSGGENLTAIQFITLCTVMENGPCSIVDIVNATAIDPATARGVVNRLRTRELLHIARDPDDHRKALIEITSTGKQVVATLIPHAKEISDATMGRLSQPEAVALTLLIKKMIHVD